MKILVPYIASMVGEIRRTDRLKHLIPEWRYNR